MLRLVMIPLLLLFTSESSFAFDPFFKPWGDRRCSLVIQQVVSEGEFYIRTADNRVLRRNNTALFIHSRAVAVTGPGSSAKLTLPGGAVLALGPNTEVVLDDYAYTPSTATQGLSVKVVKGDFRVDVAEATVAPDGRQVTGSGLDLRLKTPATIVAGAAPHQAITSAGSVPNVNPRGSIWNCTNCVVATDAVLRGHPASALPGGPYTLERLEEIYGRKFQDESLDSIEHSLLSRGNGATGIVYGYPPAGTDVGHVFNVVNENGVIRYKDGQTGKPVDLYPYPAFKFMPLAILRKICD